MASLLRNVSLNGVDGRVSVVSSARALQVEINADHDEQLSAFLRERGFEPAERHFSGPAQRLIDRGQDPASLGVNVVFRRRLAAH